MPLVLSQEEWARLVRWTDQDREDPEAARRRQQLRLLDQQSREMTTTWPNSLENVSKRNEENRRARLEKSEQTNFRFYRRYLRRHAEQQERLMYGAKDAVFKNKDAPKLFLSAVIESAALKEREEQVKFSRELKRQADEAKAADEAAIHQRAKDWHVLQRHKVQKRREANVQHVKEMFEHMNQRKDRERSEAAAEFAREVKDRETAEREMEIIDEHAQMIREKTRKRIEKDLEQSRRDLEARRREQAARDQLEDQLLELELRTRHTIDCRRKQTERQLREEKLRVLENMSKRMADGTAARDAKEQANFERAQAERTAAIEARHQAALDKKARIRADGIAERDKFLREEKQRQHEEETKAYWDLMNRFKNVELNDDYKENLRKEKERKIQEFRTDVLKQWAERTETEARAAAATKAFYGEQTARAFRHDDNRVFAHARQLLDEARACQRPERPILKALDRYCKHYRLYPMPDLPASVQRHFPAYRPRDGSAPDPQFRLPGPPPPDPGPDAPDDDDDGVKCNGLQDILDLKKNPKQTQKVEPVKGPTNGLQPLDKKVEPMAEPVSSTSQGPPNDKLPNITVVPCFCTK